MRGPPRMRHAAADPEPLEPPDELARVLLVDVALGHHLGDEHGVRAALAAGARELRVVHLAPRFAASKQA